MRQFDLYHVIITLVFGADIIREYAAISPMIPVENAQLALKLKINRDPNSPALGGASIKLHMGRHNHLGQCFIIHHGVFVDDAV